MDLNWNFASINFQEFRKARQLFKDEKYGDPTYYDYDYKYYVEEDEEYKKNLTRISWINTAEDWDEFYSLEQRYIDLEKEENKKKYKKPKQIIRKKNKN